MQAASPTQSIEQDEEDECMPVASTSGSNSFLERSKYIPLRLQSDERRLLRLLEAALSVSEYTDKVDVINWKSKTSRIHAQIKDICAILSGLVVAQNYKKGQQLVQVHAHPFTHCVILLQASNTTMHLHVRRIAYLLHVSPSSCCCRQHTGIQVDLYQSASGNRHVHCLLTLQIMCVVQLVWQ